MADSCCLQSNPEPLILSVDGVYAVPRVSQEFPQFSFLRAFTSVAEWKRSIIADQSPHVR
jgi:hypothetical protein